MTSLILILVAISIISLSSASVFLHGAKPKYLKIKNNEDLEQPSGYEYGRPYDQESYDTDSRPVNPADLVENVEELKALIHNFMVKFEENNKFQPTGQIQIIKKAINNLVLVLVTQSYVHVFKPNLLRNTLASSVKQAGVSTVPSETTQDQRAAFISELAAEVKTLPVSVVNDFILEYVAADDDNELVLRTTIKRRGDEDVDVQRLRGEVAFSKIIQEMILQSYMIDYNVEPEGDKLTITSSDGTRNRVFSAPPLDTLSKVKLLEEKGAYTMSPTELVEASASP